jgi:hypothetical protein
MTDTARRSRPRLRLLRNECEPRPLRDLDLRDPDPQHDLRNPRHREESAQALHGVRRAADAPGAVEPGQACVLIAGADGAARAEMLEQLRGLLPQDTPFVEACETWEVIAQAAGSRMVVLTGDLRDLSVRGLMRVLSRRYPLLPVVALSGCSDRAAAAPQLDVASL